MKKLLSGDLIRHQGGDLGIVLKVREGTYSHCVFFFKGGDIDWFTPLVLGIVSESR